MRIWEMTEYMTAEIGSGRHNRRTRGKSRINAIRVIGALCTTVVLGQLSGCATWSETAAATARDAHVGIRENWHESRSTSADAAELATWWTGFDDPTLTGLVERALAANNDIAAAVARLRIARGALAATGGARLPGITAAGSASRQKAVKGPSVDNKNYNIGIDAAWEVDLFGRLRGAEDAAAADVISTRANLHDIQRIIAGDVALNYMGLRDAQARLAIARKNLSIQQDNLQIAQWLNQAGMGSELDVAQAQTAVSQTRATIAPLQQSIASAIYQIDVLLDQAPGDSFDRLEVPAPLPSPPDIIGTGIPAGLLERRPDVIAARHSLEAEVIRIGVAKADLYPALRLSGFVETTAVTAGNLFDTSLAGLLGSITAPIFQGGQIRARIVQQKGSAEVALANYRASILRALQDVEDAVRAVDAARQREADLVEAEDAAARSLELAEIRYRSGAIEFQTLLDVQRSLLSVQDGRASANAARSTATVRLFKALGGGWQVAGNQ